MENIPLERFPNKESVLKFSGRTEPSVENPERNGDAIFFDPDSKLAMVFDGVGASTSPALASREACQFLKDQLLDLQPGPGFKQVNRIIRKALCEANNLLLREVPDGQTTVVVAKVLEKGDKRIVVVANIGDSRAYLFRNDSLQQITKDDREIPSPLVVKIDNALSQDDLTLAELAYFYRRHIVSQALGMEYLPVSHVCQIDFQLGDKLILTSDGVHDNLTLTEMAEIVAVDENISNNLVKKARERSTEEHFRAKPDDISVVVMEVV